MLRDVNGLSSLLRRLRRVFVEEESEEIEIKSTEEAEKIIRRIEENIVEKATQWKKYAATPKTMLTPI